ncbi:MAG: hypothetical protein JWP11_3172 [Frankiales bacterium]|jgi:hypothetical protein|nr:hypothetical protein [Frankiales bacterium]
MTRVRLAVCLAALGVLAATAAPALADDGSTRVCLMAVHDKNNPGPPTVCVWVPVDVAGQH